MKQTVRDIDLRGRRVLIRVDFNVPMDQVTCKITDETRIRESLPTILYCLERGAVVILMSHLGRPKGKVVASMSLRPVAGCLSDLLRRPVSFLSDCVGAEVEHQVKGMQPGDVALLENLRFHAEEEKNDKQFAVSLSRLGDMYVNDAFGSAHRAHASTEGVARHLTGVAGFLMEKEIKYLDGALRNPARPYVAILGGAKVSDKIGVLTRLLDQVDRVLIGGGMSYTFLKAKGHTIGSSWLEVDRVGLAKELLAKAKDRRVDFLLPSDHVVTISLEPGSDAKTINTIDIPEGWLGADIGPDTVGRFTTSLADAKTVIWNGPVGVFEQPRFQTGSKRIAETLAKLTATTVIGGGDTAACVQQLNLGDRMTHISTGGGASREFLEGKVLPGIAILQEASSAQSAGYTKDSDRMSS